MNLVRAFFPKSGHCSLNFEKGQGKPPPPPVPSSSYAPGRSLFPSSCCGGLFLVKPQVFMLYLLLKLTHTDCCYVTKPISSYSNFDAQKVIVTYLEEGKAVKFET